MLTTVIISNYNYAEFVGSCIESCLGQDNVRIIVVDDASNDGSWKTICKYTGENVKAVRLKKNSGGNARGKNVGIGLADSDYIICLDADDMLLPDSVKWRTKFFEDDSDVDFVHGFSKHHTGEEPYEWIIKNITLKPFKPSPKARKLGKEDLSPRWSFAMEASTIIAKKKLYENFGLYDEEMGWSIDREMSWRWLDHNAKFSKFNGWVSIYRCHDRQVTKDRSRKNPKKYSKLLSERQIMRKTITSENTILLSEYDYEQYIKEIR